MERRKTKIIYVDETAFTKSTIKTETYSSKGHNIRVMEKSFYSKPSYVIAGISYERGMEHVAVLDHPVAATDFAKYVRSLIKSHRAIKFCLFMDNLPAHKTKAVIKLMEENKVEYIFNVPYSPQYNPIETVFSKVKTHFKKRKLSLISNERKFNQTQEIKDAFASVKLSDVQGYVRLSHNELFGSA